MYKLEFLPMAKQDMVDIVHYISHKLCNPKAAEKLANEMIEVAERLVTFPYANSSYQPIRPLKKEYRRVLVQNYIMFYFIDENQKLITIVRVVYAKRNFGKLLE